MKTITLLSQASLDLIEIADYIALDNPPAARKFLQAVEATFARLARNPTLGVEGEFNSPHLAGIRRWRVAGFHRYLIFYREKANSIEIFRVLHGARDVDSMFGPNDHPQIE